MPYVCPNCGELNRFYREDSVERTIVQYGTETRVIDSDGDVVDYCDFDWEDEDSLSETTTDYGTEVACHSCMEGAVFCDTEEEIEEILSSVLIKAKVKTKPTEIIDLAEVE
jgi:hypothetical protein